MQHKVVLTFESVDEILKCNHSLQMKATEQYFPVVLFIMQHKVVQTFESVDEILECVILFNSSFFFQNFIKLNLSGNLTLSFHFSQVVKG